MSFSSKRTFAALAAWMTVGSAACGDDGGGGTGGGTGGGGNPPNTCILAYDFGGYGDTVDAMRIRDTTAGLGDFNLPADDSGSGATFSGQLVLRVETASGAIADGGLVEVLYYEFNQVFQTTAAGPTTIVTDVDAFSPTLGQTSNTAALATGAFAFDAAGPHILSFPDCAPAAGYNDTINSYTPDVVATGAGCLDPARSVGNVNCTGSFCGAGNLAVGDNPQDETWEQPIHDIELANDLSTLDFTADPADAEARYMLVPDRAPARTYIRWMGTLNAAASTCDDL